ncbi:hypothetical protein ACLB2K_024800 [Fragaria x ananassa]
MEIVTGKNPGYVFKFLSIFLIGSCYLALFCSASSSITQGQTIKDGQTLISDGQTFELGFFSPGNSSSRYVGIWYYNLSDPAIVWVANRESPVSDKTGVLTIGSDGNLVILEGNSTEIWSSNVSSIPKNTSAVLRDTGNLVLSTNETMKSYWESFDNPTDTFLPGMSVKVNAKEGENRAFRSWKSVNDPAPGDYFSGVDPRAAPQLMIWNGSERRWRSGHWNKLIFIGLPDMPTRYAAGFSLTDRADQNGSNYLSYTPWNVSDRLRFQIRWDGYEEQSIWVDELNEWVDLMSQPNKSSGCELYNKCGNFGLCSASDDASCECMQGFERKNWGNWSEGCERKTPLKCQRNSTNDEDGEDGFVAVKCTKVPDFADLVVVTGPQISCEQSCLNNCSCTAYADVSGLGCMIWTTELIDVQQFSKGGNTLYIRVAHADLGGSKKLSTLVISLISVAVAIFVAILIFLVWRFKAKLKVLPTTSISWLRIGETPTYDAGKSKEFSTEMSGSVDPTIDGNQANGPDLPSFNFNSVAAATDHFSLVNKLGNGGFGTVYKGVLPGLEEVAVKRLSQVSCQGLEEFKNEINLIAKLQHRNLVRLLTEVNFRIKQLHENRQIVMRGSSLSSSVFGEMADATKQALLDWSKRFMIIEGIARGLLYLHRDSRPRIIHRDLKASNILLDEDMIPKISDFGMARIFGGNQHEANTMRVVGTYGYMSPEYAMEGLFSVKSDVYSFGVLLLEIVSGRKNTSLRTSEHLSLIGYAWNLWNANTPEDLIDPSIAETCNNRSELVRCIHVGLLCVQDSADSRPTMSAVVLMLESETANLPLPREPMFTSIKKYVDTTFSTEEETPDLPSVNHVTITVVDGR